MLPSTKLVGALYCKQVSITDCFCNLLCCRHTWWAFRQFSPMLVSAASLMASSHNIFRMHIAHEDLIHRCFTCEARFVFCHGLNARELNAERMPSSQVDRPAGCRR